MSKANHNKTPTPPAGLPTRKPMSRRIKIGPRRCFSIDETTTVRRLCHELFEADIARWQEGKRNQGDLAAVFGYWIGYPMFLEVIDHNCPSEAARAQAYALLNAAHAMATRVLMEEAERHGLDPHPLYKCARVVEEIYAEDPARFYAGPYDTWPECMGPARYSLPAGQQEAIDVGEGVFVRLAVKLGVAEREDMAEVVRNVNPRHRPQVHDPLTDEKTIRDWQSSQAMPNKPTQTEFEQAHGLRSGELRRALDRHRKRRNRKGGN